MLQMEDEGHPPVVTKGVLYLHYLIRYSERRMIKVNALKAEHLKLGLLSPG